VLEPALPRRGWARHWLDHRTDRSRRGRWRYPDGHRGAGKTVRGRPET